MLIQTEPTPNPATLKFITGQDVAPTGTVECTTPEQAEQRSPLAEKLFAIHGVVSVFLGRDFIAVTKSENYDWADIQAKITISMTEHIMAGDPIINEISESEQPDPHGDATGEHADVINQIKELLNLRIRPAVAKDGGDIVFNSFNGEEGIVYLTMRGACAGCPSSTATLKMGIENMLRHYIPQVEEVRATEDESPNPDEDTEEDEESHIQY